MNFLCFVLQAGYKLCPAHNPLQYHNLGIWLGLKARAEGPLVPPVMYELSYIYALALLAS